MEKSIAESLEGLKENLPPEDQKFVSRSMNIQVDLDPEVLKPQKLHLVRPFSAMAGDIPGNMAGEGQIVMRALFDCFEKSGEVKEGVLDDLLFGFEVSGIPKLCTYEGLRVLEQKGYVEFTTLEHMPLLDPKMVASPRYVLVKYRRKLLDLVYSK